MKKLIELSDEERVSSLHAVCLDGRRLLARLLVHLAEIEERSLHAQRLLARRTPRPDVASTIRKLPTQTSSVAPTPQLEATPSVPAPGAEPTRARVEPLSEDRYKVQFTASGALRDKLERARDLMRHREPTGDVALVVERALDALLAKLEKERLGRTSRPQRKPRTAKASRVRQAVRRAVFERDGERCTFVDAEGRRCSARAFLELDHVDSRALGGASDSDNLRVACRAHNRLHAEEVFGKDYVAQRIHLRQRKWTRGMPAAIQPATVDVAMRGLVNMGFRESDARRALDVAARLPYVIITACVALESCCRCFSRRTATTRSTTRDEAPPCRSLRVPRFGTRRSAAHRRDRREEEHATRHPSTFVGPLGCKHAVDGQWSREATEAASRAVPLRFDERPSKRSIA